MKNTYYTEIYHNLAMFDTKTRIKYLKVKQTENTQIFVN